MNDPKVVRDPLYFRRTEPAALRARPHQPAAAERTEDTAVCDDRVIWLCLAGAAGLACLVGGGFGIAAGAGSGAAAGAAAILGALLAAPAAHGARTLAARDKLHRFALPPGLLVLTLLALALAPTFRWPLLGAAICVGAALVYSLFVPHFGSTVVWPIAIGLPASVLWSFLSGSVEASSLRWEIAMAATAAGIAGGAAWSAMARRLRAAPARPLAPQFLVAAASLVLAAISAAAEKPDTLGCATGIALAIGGIWWMRAPNVRQALARSVPMFVLLNFWSGAAVQTVSVPWLSACAALAVVIQFVLIVAAILRLAMVELTLLDVANYYQTPLVPVPRPERAFDYPFESYARNS